MADVIDLFTAPRVAGPGTAGFEPIPNLIPFAAPGSFDIGGIVSDLLQRFPIPRPRLPLPRGPGGPGRRIPIPVPIPDIFGIFNGDAACPEQACCKGQHVAKTKDPNSPSFGTCVRNRRMNALNPRALKRATRRLASFDRMARNAKKELKKICR